MRDSDVMRRINELVDEEHGLLHRASTGDMTDRDRQHLHELEVTADQLWDLLRQRRALRDAGLDPDEARLRDADVVEKYLQ